MSEKLTSFVVDNVKDKTSVVEYLSSVGVSYAYQYKDKYMYKCPFKDHKDDTPSFAVYTTEKYQSFYCFGCKKHGDVISLVSQYHGISFRDAIIKLGGEIDANMSQELNYTINKLKELEEDKKVVEAAKEILFDLSFNLSHMGYCYLNLTSFDVEEQSFLEKLYKKIDNYIASENVDGLYKLYQFISDENLFSQRLELWEKKQEKKLYNNSG